MNFKNSLSLNGCMAALFAFLFFGCSPSSEEEEAQRVLLAIFSHPDDEFTVAPILSKYNRLGVKVHLVIATDGRLGVTEHAGIPAGDSLAQVRREEMECVVEKLGIEPLIWIGLEDQFRLSEGLGAMFQQMNKLEDTVSAIFKELKPDVVLTWGSDGLTGHPDHRLVGDIVTQVFAKRIWNKPMSLYFYGVPASKKPAQAEGFLGEVNYVDDQYLTTRITYSDEDFQLALDANACHKSQWTREHLENWEKYRRKVEEDKVYLRPFIYSGTINREIFTMGM